MGKISALTPAPPTLVSDELPKGSNCKGSPNTHYDQMKYCAAAESLQFPTVVNAIRVQKKDQTHGSYRDYVT